PYFPSPERAFRALARILALESQNSSTETISPLEVPGLPKARGILCEYKAKEILGPLGIPFPSSRFVTTLAAALQAATEIGFPVAIKAQSTALSHKSDAGGVILGLGNAHKLAAGWNQLHANVAEHCPGLSLDGVFVESMAQPGVELIIGARRD